VCYSFLGGDSCEADEELVGKSRDHADILFGRGATPLLIHPHPSQPTDGEQGNSVLNKTSSACRSRVTTLDHKILQERVNRCGMCDSLDIVDIQQ
jgi:hypothetical protein